MDPLGIRGIGTGGNDLMTGYYDRTGIVLLSDI